MSGIWLVITYLHCLSLFPTQTIDSSPKTLSVSSLGASLQLSNTKQWAQVLSVGWNSLCFHLLFLPRCFSSSSSCPPDKTVHCFPKWSEQIFLPPGSAALKMNYSHIYPHLPSLAFSALSSPQRVVKMSQSCSWQHLTRGGCSLTASPTSQWLLKPLFISINVLSRMVLADTLSACRLFKLHGRNN